MLLQLLNKSVFILGGKHVLDHQLTGWAFRGLMDRERWETVWAGLAYCTACALHRWKACANIWHSHGNGAQFSAINVFCRTSSACLAASPVFSGHVTVCRVNSVTWENQIQLCQPEWSGKKTRIFLTGIGLIVLFHQRCSLLCPVCRNDPEYRVSVFLTQNVLQFICRRKKLWLFSCTAPQKGLAKQSQEDIFFFCFCQIAIKSMITCFDSLSHNRPKVLFELFERLVRPAVYTVVYDNVYQIEW